MAATTEGAQPDMSICYSATIDCSASIRRISTGLLSKLTMTNFDVVVPKIAGLRCAHGVCAHWVDVLLSLIFEKASSEPAFCPMYSLVCDALATAHAILGPRESKLHYPELRKFSIQLTIESRMFFELPSDLSPARFGLRESGRAHLLSSLAIKFPHLRSIWRGHICYLLYECSTRETTALRAWFVAAGSVLLAVDPQLSELQLEVFSFPLAFFLWRMGQISVALGHAGRNVKHFDARTRFALTDCFEGWLYGKNKTSSQEGKRFSKARAISIVVGNARRRADKDSTSLLRLPVEVLSMILLKLAPGATNFHLILPNFFAPLPRPIIPTISTPRLTLRRARFADLEIFHTLLSDPETMRYGSHLPFTCRNESEAWLQNMIEGWHSLAYSTAARPRSDAFVIELNGGVIGKVGSHQFPEISYMLLPTECGKGYAIEALNAYIAYARQRGYDQLTADVDPRNERSIKLLLKAGFWEAGREQGTYQLGDEVTDSIYYCIDLRGSVAVPQLEP